MTRFCEVCGHRRLSPRTKGDVCFRCRQDGAAWARDWMVGLRTTGLMPKEIAPVVGLSGAQVRARLSEYGELAGQPSGGSRVDAMIEGLQEIDA